MAKKCRKKSLNFTQNFLQRLLKQAIDHSSLTKKQLWAAHDESYLEEVLSLV
ncbi:MAG: hypothetical protein QMC24_14185 [Akkermansiaceae bacterium]